MLRGQWNGVRRTGFCIGLALLFLCPTARAQTGFSKLISWGQLASTNVACPPGNSLPHINFCYQLDYEGNEIDVMVSKDHVPVVCHDVVVTNTHYDAALFTFEELQQMTIGTWQGQTQRIPTLEAALRTNGHRGLFMADMRINPAETWAISNAVREAGFDERLLAMTAYSIEAGAIFKRAFPGAQIFVKQYQYPTNIARAYVDAIAAAGLDGIMLQMSEGGQPLQDFVDYLHCQGLRLTLFVHYPENNLAQLQGLVDAGTDYILTVHHEFRNQVAWLAPDAQRPELQSRWDAGRGKIILSWRYQRPYAHRLQRSLDLVDWADMGVRVQAPNAQLEVSCEVPRSAPNAYYRLRYEP